MIYHRFCGSFKHNSRTSKDAFLFIMPNSVDLAPHRSREWIFTDFYHWSSNVLGILTFQFFDRTNVLVKLFLGQEFKKNFANIFLWGQWINTFVYLYGDNFSVSKSLGVWGENGPLSIRPKWPFYPRGAFYFRAKFSRSLFTGGINFLWRLIRLHP